ncbi:hypothetical protein AF332_11245 [Sporosarcina globispora]|uniref:Uncharacterized protein n=1 Tax=Sporosarcina globispora TaxID=1459 RepID=A0A0M0GBX5_SPOGL|nr:hypothetical protein [Sporosarcina globispora]KON87344.1 hypothetical protein AF332_11245 [Sporosarcina globispora]
MIEVKIVNPHSKELESLYTHCSRLSKRNNSVLYLLESYLDKKLLDDPQLAEIRDILLTVSADITKLTNHLHIECGDENEGL